MLYKDSFEYSADWYNDVYHEGLRLGRHEPRTGDHPDRDFACYHSVGVSRNDNILICGCGGGDNAKLLIDEFGCDQAKLTMVDFSPASVEFCRKHFPKANTMLVDVSDMPFADGRFDLVSALDITEHLPPIVYDGFLLEAFRVCSASGRTVILPGMTNRPEHINLKRLGEIVDDMIIAGFSDVREVLGMWVIAGKGPIG